MGSRHACCFDAVKHRQGSRGASRNDFDQAIAHIEKGDIPVDDLVDTSPLEEAIGAFDDSIAKTTQKAVLLPLTPKLARSV